MSPALLARVRQAGTFDGLTLDGLTLDGLTLDGFTLDRMTLNRLRILQSACAVEYRLGVIVLVSLVTERGPFRTIGSGLWPHDRANRIRWLTFET